MSCEGKYMKEKYEEQSRRLAGQLKTRRLLCLRIRVKRWKLYWMNRTLLWVHKHWHRL